MKKLTFNLNHDNYNTPAILTLPEGLEKYPCVILVHGSFSNKDEAGNGFLTLSEALANNGIASIRFDQIGTGDSPVDFQNFSINTSINDCKAVYDYIANRDDITSIAILGWSQGACIALQYIANNPNIKGMISYSGLVDGKLMLVPEEYEIAKKEGFFPIDPGFIPPVKRGLGWYEDLLTIPYWDNFKKITQPIIAIAGKKDDVVPCEVSVEMIKEAPNEASKLILLDNCDHCFNLLQGETEIFEQVIHHTLQILNNLF
ncbi:MAG: alpha/beta fold hydrolase [Erysipelotrichaceae bacterium]|nr:alpha/beta fold hydrolase [Erysipelotrichaceae bacterium]